MMVHSTMQSITKKKKKKKKKKAEQKSKEEEEGTTTTAATRTRVPLVVNRTTKIMTNSEYVQKG